MFTDLPYSNHDGREEHRFSGSGRFAHEPAPGSPEAVEPDIDDTYACACHCTCCAPVEAEGERCPMCSEACGPEAVEQAPRAPEDFCWPADASPEQITGGVMTSRQCEKLVQEAFPVARATIRQVPVIPELTFTSSIGESITLTRIGDRLVLSGEEDPRRPLRMGPETILGTALLAAREREVALEETNRELADALEAIRKQIAVTRDVPSDDLARYVDEWDDAVQRIDEICTETLGKAGRS